MADEDIRIEPRTGDDMNAVCALLSAEGVSCEGIDRSSGYVVRDGSEVVGHLGIECLGDGFAIESFMVLAKPYRGKGLTDLLGRRIEALARDHSIDDLVLFTDRPEGLRWAVDRGFLEIDPELIPDRVQSWSLFGLPVVRESRAFRRPVIRGILFFADTNCARTLMCECIARAAAPHGVVVYSSGLHTHAIDELVKQVLREIDLDPEGLHVKPFEHIPLEEINFIVSMDRDMSSALPIPWKPIHQICWQLPELIDVEGDEPTRIAAFREVREDIRMRVRRYFG